MNKKSSLLIGLIALFTLLTLGLGLFHANQSSQIDEDILIIKTAQKTFKLSLDEIMAYDKTVFVANVKASGADPVESEFGGILLSELIMLQGIQLKGNETFTFKAIDGYQTNVSFEEVMQANNVYLVYERNGVKTANRANGGTGPLEIVIALDTFSQRWNKHLIQIEITP